MTLSLPTIVKPNGKTGQGDLVIKHANIGGDVHLIIDAALIHEFGGNHMADVSLNGGYQERPRRQAPRVSGTD